MLTTETKAPDFTLSTATAEGPKQITLSKEIGSRNILLLFVPMAFTGVCTEELCTISKGIGAYDSLDCSVYGISGDNPFAQQAWAQKEGITIPLLSDYDHAVAQAYGVVYESFLPQIGLGIPSGEGLDILLMHLASVAVAEHRLKHHADRVG